MKALNEIDCVEMKGISGARKKYINAGNSVNTSHQDMGNFIANKSEINGACVNFKCEYKRK